MTDWLERLEAGHEAHLWYVLLDAAIDERLLAAYRNLLSPEERARNGRFVFEAGRREHLVTRALVRTTLSLYCPSIDQRAWVFEASAFGRPEVAAPRSPSGPRLRFNLSHTDGLIVCAVAAGREIGVDVEATSRAAGIEIADRYFSPSETTELRSLPQAAQPSRFFDYWTLKEAYIKARGLGLQLPLDQFSFDLGSLPTIGIAFGPEIEDDPASWQFDLRSPTPGHRLAVAIRRRPDEPDLALHLVPTVPLGTPPPK